VRALTARGADVVVLTRSPEKAGRLPAGVAGVVGDLQSPGTVRSIFPGIDAVFLLTALSQGEAHEGLLAVNGARMAGVKRIVAMTLQDPEGAPHVPHFGAKIPIEAAVRGSGCEWTLLRPNSFFQNDYWYKELLLGPGVYPQPFGDVGLSRVDVRDIADTAALALTEPGHAGRVYNLVGPRPWTGSETAAAWGRALGRTVAYAGNDLETWEKHMLAVRPDWMVFDIKLMYAHFQKNGWKAKEGDVAILGRVLGRPPRAFEDFAAETAALWKTA